MSGPETGSRRDLLLLAAILLFGGALRLVRIGSVPPGVFCDEAAIANNARSLALTGRDASGTWLPLHPHERSFEAWGIPGGIVYKPIFLYAMAPWVGILGASPSVIRMPAAFFGLAGIAAVFLLARRLLGRRTALAAAALLAVWPWHHHFSRVAFEAISFPTLLTFGVLALVRGLEAPRALWAGAVLLGLCLYAYPTAQVFVPLFAAAFAWIHREPLRRAWKPAAGAAALLALIFLPIALMILGGVHQERANSLLITSADIEREKGVLLLKEWRADFLLDSRPARFGFLFVYNYLSHLGPGFLFLDGDPNIRHGVPGFGVCSLVALPLLVLGIAALWRDRREASSRLLFAWLLLYPVAPSLTVESPHAIRALSGVPVLALIAGRGFDVLRDLVASTFSRGGPRWRAGVAAVVAAAALAGVYDVVRYVAAYHGEYPRVSAEAWQGGVGPGVESLARRKEEGRRAWVSSRIFNAYAFIRLFGRIDPRRVDPSLDLNEQLAPLGWGVRFSPENRRPGDLALLTPADVEDLNASDVLEEIRAPDGRTVLFVVRFRTSGR